MNEKIIIPSLCKVGFQHRENTYTKRLGYVIWHDGKVWRKEPSWENWRTKVISEEEFNKRKQETFEKNLKSVEDQYRTYSEHDFYTTGRGKEEAEKVLNKGWDYFKKQKGVESIESFNYYPGNTSYDQKLVPFEFKNEPREGFVLNKRVGGYTGGWNHRETYCRVFDPLGFEIEITLENLLYILENTSSIKGKGLEGKFLYGWSGKDLVLLPENAPEFKQMLEFTSLQNNEFKKNDLIEGKIYKLKNNSLVTYMGYRTYYDEYQGGLAAGKKFWVSVNGDFSFVTLNKFGALVGDDPDYAELLVRFNNDKRIKDNKIQMVLATENDFVFDKGGYAELYQKVKNSYEYTRVTKEKVSKFFSNEDPVIKYSIWENHKELHYLSISMLLQKHQLWVPKTMN